MIKPEILEKTKKIGNIVGAHVWLHNNTVKYYTKLNNRFDMIMATMMFIMGIPVIPMLISSFNDNNPPYTKWIELSLFVFTIIAGITTVVKNQINFPYKIQQHQRASTSNSHLYLKIKKAMLRGITGDQIYFYQTIYKKQISLQTDVNTQIPTKILNLYYRKFKKKAIDYDTLIGNDLTDIDSEKTESMESDHKLHKHLDLESKKSVINILSNATSVVKNKKKKHLNQYVI